jgi:hypothetical protein
MFRNFSLIQERVTTYVTGGLNYAWKTRLVGAVRIDFYNNEENIEQAM